ncbi:MAG: hypothetical protein WCO25_03700 [Candidatus Uhrbacteria bacterium]
MRPDIRIEIDVDRFGSVTVTARREDVPNQGLLGPLVLVACSASLTEGRYAITAGPIGDPRVEIIKGSPFLVEATRARLVPIAHELKSLALRPSLA